MNGNSEFRAVIFSDGTRIDFPCTTNASNFKDFLIQPAESEVRAALLRYYTGKTPNEGLINGIQFLDKNSTIILKAGYWDAPSDLNRKEYRIDIKEGERIVGVKSGRRGMTNAWHHDV